MSEEPQPDGTPFEYDGVMSNGSKTNPRTPRPTQYLFTREVSFETTLCQVTAVPLRLPIRKEPVVEDYDLFFVRVRIAGREGSYRRATTVRKRGSDDLFFEMATELCERRRDKKLAPLWVYEPDWAGTPSMEG